MLQTRLADTQKHWEKYSTIRSRPQRILSENNLEKGHFYPLARQPLCIHPEIIKLGSEVRHYLLTQSAYKYIHDITILETEIVNRATLSIVNGHLPVNFNLATRRDALSIIIDEAYHAYVAMDCLVQIEHYTGIKPLELNDVLSIEQAIKVVKKLLPESMHLSFELIAVCIAENTNNQDILVMSRDKELHEFFKNILCDHYADEARHSVFFNMILTYFWKNLSPDYQLEIGKHLPYFISCYLNNDLQQHFDYQLLKSLNFSEENSRQIINETYGEQQFTAHHPIIKNILALFEQANLLTIPAITELFINKNWLITA